MIGDAAQIAVTGRSASLFFSFSMHGLEDDEKEEETFNNKKIVSSGRSSKINANCTIHCSDLQTTTSAEILRSLSRIFDQRST